ATGQQLTLVNVAENGVKLDATGGPGGTLTGEGTNNPLLSGTGAEKKTYFSDGPTPGGLTTETSTSGPRLTNPTNAAEIKAIQQAGKELLDFINDFKNFGGKTPFSPYNNEDAALKALQPLIDEFERQAARNLPEQLVKSYFAPILEIAKDTTIAFI